MSETTTLRFEPVRLTSADFGGMNCLPDIYDNASLHSRVQCSSRITGQDRETFDALRIHTVLPYQMQSLYDRSRREKTFTAAVLENEALKATFLPQLGGRLWSLFDKREQRELLFVNDVLQPCNLALRNAWFAGGVEWNCGVRGHALLTCSPLFTRQAVNEKGDPLLIMYEYERVTRVTYKICATLQQDALLLKMTIENTEDRDKWTYWWSNIAAPENPKTRVIVPATETFYCGYREGVHVLDSGPYPHTDQLRIDDLSYPARYDQTWDMFFKIPEQEHKWIAAVEEDGRGLLQYSDDTLIGRKLFAWGAHPGGRNWNHWLSDAGQPYIEIQAGLAPTQQHVVRLGANEKISWMEGYCAVSGDPHALHSLQYSDAVREIGGMAGDRIARLDESLFRPKDTPAPVLEGSGWGALEGMLRGSCVSEECDFPQSSIGGEQKEWYALLVQGRLPEHAPCEPIVSYEAGEEWISRIAETMTGTWYEHYHLGVMHYAAKAIPEAEAHFEASLAAEENPWALRNLAKIEKNIRNDRKKAAEYIARAYRMKPDYLPLAVEYAASLIDNGQNREMIALYDSMAPAFKAQGRLQLLLAAALTREGELDRAKAILTPQLCIPDIKEGEYSVSHIWVELYTRIMAEEENVPADSLSPAQVQARYPVPQALDFRQDL